MNEAAQWWLSLWPTDESLQHLQYYDPGVGSDFCRKITSSTQLGFWHHTLALQLTCVWGGVLFFPVSASVASKRLLWPNKQRKDWWLQTMKLETETEVRSKNTPAITDYRHRCRERQQNENPQDCNFKYHFEVTVLYSSLFFWCHFLFLLCYTSEGNIVLFIPLL